MRYRAKSILKRTLSFATCMAFSLCFLAGCADKEKTDTSSINDEPNITITTISPIDPPVNSEEVDNGEIDDVYSLVCSSVEYKLSEAGFETDAGVAYTTENDNYEALGIYYYDDEFKIIEDGAVKPVGFVEIVDESVPFYQADNEESLIVVDNLSEIPDDTELICTYNYDNIGSSHFVYKDKYVTYYQQSSMRVVYTEMDNDPENYNLDYGSLYDYDNNQYIYDEDIFSGEYVTHMSAGLFSDEDYSKLEETFKAISDEQEKNGYIVEEYNIVYISPESIQAYLDSEEEDTFFGYSISDLTSAFGLGTALEYTENGLIEADYRQNTLGEYNWKSFLTKVGIGSGIILVGAVVTSAVGGPTIGVALLAISKIAVGASLVDGLGTLSIETAKNMLDGMTITDALKGASGKGLDAFANSFMITAAIAGGGSVASSIINPVVSKVENAEKLIDRSDKYLRNKAVEDAWKIERKAVLTNTSRYKWTLKQKIELITKGKIKGMEGHHIRTVKELSDTADRLLIADPNDIVFLSKQKHLLMHNNNFNNVTNTKELLKVMPWVEKRLVYLGA